MKPARVAIFIASVIFLLAIVGAIMPDDGLDVGFTKLYLTDLHQLAETSTKQQETANEPSAEQLALEKALEVTSDSLEYYRLLTDSGDLRFWLPSDGYFDSFWEKAEHAREENRVLRVLHYGDSQIEMDHITSRLRSGMQNLFGGSGPGMLPAAQVTPIVPIRYSSRGDMVHIASFGDSLAVKSRGNYGPMMQCFRLSGGQSTIVLRPSNNSRVDKRNKEFARIRFIANNTGSLRVSLTDMSTKKTIQQSAMSHGVGVLEWKSDSNYHDGVKMVVSGQADLYALLVDGEGGGMAVDNIPMRGCSGQQFTLVNQDLLTQAYASIDVGLIMMQFGGNSVPYIKTGKQISAYCKSLGNQIDFLHRCCPDAKILFVGPSDMSTHVGNDMRSYPVLEQLIDSLATMATTHDAAFWSIYHAMGGQGSMVTWVKEGLAGADYVHFSQKGADLMGDRLMKALYNSYRRYTLHREEMLRRYQREKMLQDQMEQNNKSRKRRK